MYPYGKMSWTAVAAMSHLAELYGKDQNKASSAAIAENRQISKPLVAKVLTQLSQAGLIDGSPGPGGGYFLTRPPADITLIEIVRLFEKLDLQTRCPFGPHWCGKGDPCPIHDDIVKINEEGIAFLQNTTLKVFQKPS